jgi:heme A synthase
MHSMARLARFAWLTLACNVGVILWGAYVRATGSGAGCGSHWPLCNGEVLPRAPSVQTLIEFSHRLTSGLALLAVVALFWWIRRAFPRGHAARRAAAASVALMITEAAVGAGLVLFELVADNASMARALFMAAHLVNTFLLVAALTLTAHWSSGGVTRFSTLPQTVAVVFAVSIGMLLVGMSGAVAALGDTLYPSASLAEALAADVSPTSHLLVRLRVLHPALATAVILVLLAVVSRLGRGARDGRGRRAARAAMFIAALQLAAGVLNVVLLAPVWLQLTHLLLADLLWIAWVIVAASALAADVVAVSTSPPAVTEAARGLSARHTPNLKGTGLTR